MATSSALPGFATHSASPAVPYAGRRFERFCGHDPLYLELTGGLLYGHVPPYEHKVPMNHHGFSPGAVVALGWRLSPELSAQVNLLGYLRPDGSTVRELSMRRCRSLGTVGAFVPALQPFKVGEVVSVMGATSAVAKLARAERGARTAREGDRCACRKPVEWNEKTSDQRR